MQLNLKQLFERAERYFPDNEIVSRRADGTLFRYRYSDYAQRVRRLADALGKLGIRVGDRVGTLEWNTYRHFELYAAVTCFGAVLHTINVRLGDEDISYILNKAQDVALIVAPEFLPMIERIAPQLPFLKHIIIAVDVGADVATKFRTYNYEALLNTGKPDYPFADIHENSTAGMCFTSATTGRPKGVIYSHRDLYLHSMALCMTDVMGLGERDTIMPVVPMFHANAWGLPYAALAVGAKMVLPGPRPMANDILDLIAGERITFFAAAVTVGFQIFDELQRRPRDISSLRELMLGGSATPATLMRRFQEGYGISIYTAWGATECAPIATVTHLRRQLLSAGSEARIGVRTRQGIPVPGIEVRVLDADGKQVPWNDTEVGEVYVRGLWIAKSYYEDDRSKENFVEGWWKSGDLATVDDTGSMRLIDRSKDLIKSGGEWISSIDLENELTACPGVSEAAVVAVPHEKWQERPVAYVVRSASGPGVDVAELTRWLARRFPKWWLPDSYVFVADLPKTGVGKINKRELRGRVVEDLTSGR
ncbi:long-chain fatty acid--CoA ligase [uncultured Bradyrhizobium sp.]|nr:long-chain fatty acid--CoA ligase [uncultured Bradyrhizobium sp.]